MPLYEVTFVVDALGWATLRADDEAEAREYAVEHFNAHEVEIIDVRINKIEAVPEDEA